MPDFMLEPDAIEPERPVRGTPPRLVSTGRAPTAEVPTQRAGKETPPCYAPCLLCGTMILSGQTTDGHTLHQDTSRPCYAPVWANKAPQPTLLPSRAYVVHQCQGACPASPRSVS
jgi:hypothetical protein